MFTKKFVFLLGCLGLRALEVTCIVSKGISNATDNVPAQSIDRDYVAGYEEGYGHGAYGLSAHATYGFAGGHEGYAVHEDTKHGHHLEDHHHHHYSHHKHQDSYHKALAIKGLLVPLAGVALLGAAAAFVSNPILLQLGVISGAPLGRRKRDVESNIAISLQDQTRLKEIKLLEKFMSQVPQQEIRAQEKRMLADYLSCSGLTGQNLCLDRLACELHSPEGRSMPMEADVLAIVVNDILANDFVPEKTKAHLSEAVDRGKNNFGCHPYRCPELENQERPSFSSSFL